MQFVPDGFRADKFKILENHASSSYILKDGDPCHTELNMDPSNPFGLPSMLPQPQLLAPSVGRCNSCPD